MSRLLPLMALVLMPGCLTIGAFQTPEVLPPGRFVYGGGFTVSESEDVMPNYGDPGAGDQSVSHLLLYGRIGVGAKMEVAFRSAMLMGLSAGLDVKRSLTEGPIRTAIAVGAERSGGATCIPLGPSETSPPPCRRDVAAAYAALLAATDRFYGAAKVVGLRTTEEYEGKQGAFRRLAPALTLGVVGDAQRGWEPMLEVTALLLPRPMIAVGGGIRVRLPERE